MGDVIRELALANEDALALDGACQEVEFAEKAAERREAKARYYALIDRLTGEPGRYATHHVRRPSNSDCATRKVGFERRRQGRTGAPAPAPARPSPKGRGLRLLLLWLGLAAIVAAAVFLR
jgi:hypothetical protein